MNKEIARIRKNRNLDEIMYDEPVKIDPDVLLDKIYALNINMSYLYSINDSKEADVNMYIDKITDNIYLILEIFNDMNIYPDYFYDIIVDINKEYRDLVPDGKIQGNYEVYNRVDFSAKISQLIKEGLNSKKYQINQNNNDISKYYLDMVNFFQENHMPYDNTSLTACQNVFNEIYYNINNIINNTLNNSDFIFVDIECLARLLFEYISFFAAIGVNPKKYLEECIDYHTEDRKMK